VYEAPMLLAFLNTIFLCAIPLGVAYMAAKSHQSTGLLSFLLIGCGLVFFGTSSLYAGWVMPLAGGPNPTVTLHNLGSLLAGLFQFAGVHFFVRELAGIPEKGPRFQRYGIIYAGIFIFVSILAALAFWGRLPVFFDPLTGPSLLRQFVLGGAVFLFAVTGLGLLESHAFAKTEFAYWYGLAVWLIFIGLACVFLQPSVGSALGWAGRGAQYIGCIYFIFAFLQSRREIPAVDSKKGWTLWPYLERRVNERTSELTQINTALQKEIAERLRTEEALSESESRFHFMFQYHDAVMLLIDPDSGQIVDANESAEKFYGYSVFKLKTMRIEDINTLPPEEVERLHHQASLKGINHFIFPHRLASGEIRTVEAHSSPFTLNGKTTLFSVIHDITDRKQAENLLQQTRKNYETFFNSIDDFLFVLDEQGNILHTNTTVTERLGYSDQELLGQSVLMIHPPERRQEAGRIVGEMLAGVTAFCPVPIMTKSGEQIPVETRVTRGFWDGKPVIFGVTKDISQLKLSEEKFSKAFQSHSTLMALSRQDDGEYIEVNDLFLETLGFTREELIGKKSSELNLFAEPSQRSQIIENMQKDGVVKDIEVKVRTKDGSLRTGLFSIAPIYVGKDPCLLTVMVDITERKHAEVALSESEEKFRAIVEQSSEGIMLIDEQGIIIEWNRAQEKIMGITQAEAIGNPVWDIQFRHVPTTRKNHMTVEKIRQSTLTILETGLSTQFNRPMEMQIESASGELKTIVQNAFSIKTEKGYRIGAIIYDITAHKLAEEALTASEAKNRALLNAIPDIMMLLNQDGLIFDYHTPSMEMLVMPPEQFLQKNFRDFLPPDAVPMFHDWFEKVKITGQVQNIEFDWSPTDGRKSFEIRLTVVDSERLLAIVRDVTERKQAEKIIRQYADELEKRVEERTLELVRASHAKDEFLATMSHELRTPLTGILGYSETLLEGVRGPMLERQEQAVQIIHSSGEHLLGLINEILDVSRIESGKLELFPKNIDVNEICQSSLVFINQLADKKSIAVEYLPSPIAPFIFADSKRLKQILINLLSNAVKFTPEMGKIKLEICPNIEESLMSFSVTDTGIGISPENLQKLFKPFTQVDGRLSHQYEGTGLGLALVKKLVELHNGSIEVQSEVGIGSRFTFTLPWKQLPV